MVVGLPDPSKTWEFRDVSIDRSDLRTFHKHSIIEIDTPHDARDPATWRVTRKAYDLAQRSVDDTSRFDCCGATGVRNIDGDLRCKGCDRIVPPDEFKRVVGPV